MVVVAVFVYPSVEIFFFISKTDRDLGNNYKLVVIDSWAELGGNNTHADTLRAFQPLTPSLAFMNRSCLVSG